MAARTYLIGLYLVVKALHSYITRNQVRIQANATTQQWLCIEALLNAVNECLPLIVPAPPIE